MAPRRRARGRIHRASRLFSAAALAAAALAGARGARAQTQILDLPTPSIAPPPLTGDIEDVGRRAFWRAGRQRWFFASTLEAGNLYLRAGGAVGYGKPHWMWAGVEGSSAVAPGGGVTYGGIRLASPYVDLRAGARYTFTGSQHFLVTRDSYTREELDHAVGPKLRYVTLEAEIAAGYPLLGGAVFGVAGLYHPTGTPEGWSFFDQTLQFVAAPPLLYRARAGYLAGVDKWDMLRVGAAVELSGTPDRGVALVRAGPGITAFITHHLEAYGQALLTVYSLDDVGLAAGQLGELGFRYRWATGDRWPELP